MIIKGKRIYLRDYYPSDFEDYYALVSDPLTRKLSILTTPASADEARQELNSIINEQKERERRRFVLGVFLNTTDRYIGDAGFEILKQNDEGGIAEIGYFIDRLFWGQGYATELSRLLIGHCFTEYHLHKVVASCDKRNGASEKVMRNCGMKKEGIFRKNRYKNAVWHDELKYGILKEDWMRMRHGSPIDGDDA